MCRVPAEVFVVVDAEGTPPDTAEPTVPPETVNSMGRRCAAGDECSVCLYNRRATRLATAAVAQYCLHESSSEELQLWRQRALRPANSLSAMTSSRERSRTSRNSARNARSNTASWSDRRAPAKARTRPSANST